MARPRVSKIRRSVWRILSSSTRTTWSTLPGISATASGTGRRTPMPSAMVATLAVGRASPAAKLWAMAGGGGGGGGAPLAQTPITFVFGEWALSHAAMPKISAPLPSGT